MRMPGSAAIALGAGRVVSCGPFTQMRPALRW